jgi:hypothetical protein
MVAIQRTQFRHPALDAGLGSPLLPWLLKRPVSLTPHQVRGDDDVWVQEP